MSPSRLQWGLPLILWRIVLTHGDLYASFVLLYASVNAIRRSLAGSTHRRSMKPHMKAIYDAKVKNTFFKMLSSLSELLEALRSKEAQLLKQYDIKHAPTIGDMYEGLTRDIVGRAIPKELGLQIVEGFIEGLHGEKSNQADVLLVKGEGRRIPYTSKFFWPIKDVLAIFEVKKTLYGESLFDSFAKMAKVNQLHCDFHDSGGYEGRKIAFPHKNFARATGFYPKIQDVGNFPKPLPEIHSIILLEHLAPVRIVLGYGGYVGELALREGICRLLHKLGPGPNRGMKSLPSLIICEKNSVVKLNGMPYCDRQDDINGWWNVMVSNSENPIRIMLEMLWTKIGMELGILLPMDDSLNQERFAPFLMQKYTEIDQGGTLQAGFMFDFVDSLPSDPIITDSAWEPPDADIVDSVAMMQAAREGVLKVDDSDFCRFAEKYGTTTSNIIHSLVKKRLLGWADPDKSIARPIEESMVTIFTPDGRSFAADQSQSGMLALWTNQKLSERESKKEEK